MPSRFGPAVAALLSLTGLATFAGDDAAPKAPPQAVPGVEQITVRLAQFDVVVRDKNGRLVHDLTPKDFKVVEDGVPLDIVAVDEWGGQRSAAAPSPSSGASSAAPAQQPSVPSPETSPPASTPAQSPQAPEERRSFLIVFDALGETTALRMSQAKTAATQFVRTRFRPGDVGAVYQIDLAVRAQTGVTSDREALASGIQKVAWLPPSSLADQVSESVLAYMGETNQSVALNRLQQQSATVAGQLDWQRDHIYDSLTDLTAVFQGMPGKRVMVLASPGFPMTTTSDQRFQLGGFTPKFRQLVKTLATYGVTVYSLDLGTELSAGDASNAIDWRVAVGKLGMDENVLSDLGLERTLGTNSASSRRQFLGVIASESGGRMLTDTNLDKAFAAIDEESTRFYRISCRVPVTATNRYRSLKVTVTRDGVTVAGRRGRYSDIVPLERLPVSTVPSSVDSLAGYKRLDARGVAVPLPAAGADKIPVTVVLEPLGPIDVPTDPQGVGKVDLDVLIVARAAGEVVARYQRGMTATLRQGVDVVRKGFRVEGRLEMVPGIYEVQGTVRLGAPPQVATWTGSVAVPPQSKSATPSILGPIMTTDRGSTAPLLSQPPSPPGSDPLLVKPGFRVLPASSTEFFDDETLLTIFWLRDFAAPEETNPHIEMKVSLIDAAGAVVDAPSQLLFFGPSAGVGFSAVARLDCSKLASGTYIVQVAAKPVGGAEVLHRGAPFVVSSRPPAPPLAVSASAASSGP